MKKLILLLLVVLLSANYVLAGGVHYLDFSSKNVAILTMSERDAAKFMFPVREYFKPEIIGGKEQIKFREKEEEQIFMLRNTRQDNAGIEKADVTAFVSDAPTPYYTTLNRKAKLQLDFELDRVPDMEIRLLGVDGKNATFEFIILDNGNADYRPTKYADEDENSGMAGMTSGAASLDKIKAYAGKAKNIALNNQGLAAITIVILLVLLANRRQIERMLRRTF